MRYHTLLRRARSVVNGPIAWIHTRSSLTPQERHNLQMSNTPVAVLTASLGGGSHTAR